MPHSVCLIAGEYPPSVGGVADYTALLARELKQRGHTVAVVAGAPRRGSRARGIDAGVAVRHVSDWGALTVVRLAQFLRSTHVEIVHLQYQAAPFNRSLLLHLLPALLGGMQVSARFVTTFHDLRRPYLFPKAGRLRLRAIEFLLRRSDGVVFTDPTDLVQAGRKLGAAWIPIGANVEPGGPADRAGGRARWGFGDEDVVLLYFGFLNGSKGVDGLLHALGLLLKRGVPARILLLGEEQGASDGTNRETALRAHRLATELGLADRIIRTGWLPPDEVSEAMGAADVAVLPYEDGASLRRGSLLACFAHGVPVVTTRPLARPQVARGALVPPFDRPGDFSIDDKVAELVTADDEGLALADAVGRVVADRERSEHLSTAGRALAAQLSWEAIATATTTFYDRVLG